MSRAARTLRLASVTAAALALAACGGSDGKTTRILAAQGGDATSSDGKVTVTVPAGALSADADVQVISVPGPAAGAGQVISSRPYAVRISPASVTLSAPVTVAISADAAPVHPQLGELATLSGTTWTRLPSSFLRGPQTVLGLTSAIDATYRVVFRSLQKVDPASAPAQAGFQVFMYETFGDEDFFSGGLGLAALLNGVDPATAVGLGVQVDLARVPAPIASVMTGTDYAAKAAALADPATTVALVKAGAVVGVVDKSPAGSQTLTSVGVTCALCHQLVKPTSFQLSAPPAAATPLPIGPLVLDGKPNLKMDAGKILSFTSGAVNAGLASTLAGWGPGLFDVRNPTTANAALDDGANDPTITPPIWNFVDLEADGYPFGWDGLFFGENALASQAEAVYHLVMNGKGAFGTAKGALPPALRVTPPDRILSKLPGAAVANPTITAQPLLDLQAWMRSITSPTPGAFDATRAEQGWRLFNARGCAACHRTAELSGTSRTLVDVGAAGDLAGGVHVPGLRGVAAKGPPYLHDGSAATLDAAVEVMASAPGVASTTGAEKAAIVEYLKSL